MLIRKINDTDIQKVVDIHNSAFQGFFLTQLGPAFLTLYYRSVLHSPQGVILGYFENGELCGFAAAAKVARGFNSNLVKSNLFPFILEAIKIFFKSPLSIIRLVRNMTKVGEFVEDDESYAELFSIGVSALHQGKGIGRQLLSAMEADLIRQNIDRLSLTTDYYDNEKAIGFYESMHYKVMYDFVAYPNRRMLRMIKNLNERL